MYLLVSPVMLPRFDMCAGVPSEHATNDIIDSFGMKKESVKNFRYRGDGWPGLTKAVSFSGDVKTMTYNESWGNILNRKLQARCKVCADGTGEAADIICADAWHKATDGGYPSFEEQDGRSLILVRTKVGQCILEEACKKNFVKLTGHYNLSDLAGIQPYQKNRKQTAFSRMLALKVLGVNTPVFKGHGLKKLVFTTSPLIQIKAFIGAFRRKIRGRF